MNKRDRFINDLKAEAKKRGLPFRVETWHGKGGHAMVYVGDKLTTVPAREIDPRRQAKSGRPLGWID